jgi:hypothetical protein
MSSGRLLLLIHGLAAGLFALLCLLGLAACRGKPAAPTNPQTIIRGPFKLSAWPMPEGVLLQGTIDSAIPDHVALMVGPDNRPPDSLELLAWDGSKFSTVRSYSVEQTGTHRPLMVLPDQRLLLLENYDPSNPPAFGPMRLFIAAIENAGLPPTPTQQYEAGPCDWPIVAIPRSDGVLAAFYRDAQEDLIVQHVSQAKVLGQHVHSQVLRSCPVFVDGQVSWGAMLDDGSFLVYDEAAKDLAEAPAFKDIALQVADGLDSRFYDLHWLGITPQMAAAYIDEDIHLFTADGGREILHTIDPDLYKPDGSKRNPLHRLDRNGIEARYRREGQGLGPDKIPTLTRPLTMSDTRIALADAFWQRIIVVELGTGPSAADAPPVVEQRAAGS